MCFGVDMHKKGNSSEDVYNTIEDFLVGMSASVIDDLLHSSKNSITVVTNVLEVIEKEISDSMGLDSRYSVLMDDLTREINNAFDQSSEGLINLLENKYIDDYEVYYTGREIADFAIAGVGLGLAGKGLFDTASGGGGIVASIFGTVSTGGAGAAITVPSLGASVAAVAVGVAEVRVGWNIGKYAYDNGWKNDKKRVSAASSKKALKDANLPTTGKIRYVPPKNWTPTQPLPKKNGGYIDKFDNIWTKGPSRTKGQSFEWDVQLSKTGKQQLGQFSRDGSHLNVSLDGKITHK